MTKNLRFYVDDNTLFVHVGDVMYYPPYNAYYPSDQTKLLLLWDELNISHVKKKQIYGPVVPYVGFDMDPNTMTILLSDDQQADLIAKVKIFGKVGKCDLLLEFQQLAGHIN